MLLDVLREIGPYLVILTLFLLGWRIRGRLDKYDNKLDQIIDTTNVNSNLIGNLSHVLVKKKVLSSDDLIEINKTYVESLKIQRLNPNPITKEELDRVNGYISKAKHSLLTPAEFKDFKELVRKLQIENPDVASTAKLANYVAFISGTYGDST